MHRRVIHRFSAMNRLLLTAASVIAASGTASAQDRPVLTSVDAQAPIFAGTFHVATGQFVPASKDVALSANTARGAGSDVVYNCNNYSGFFYDINDGTSVTDEGRLPSTSSPVSASPVSVTGMANSYRITEVQLGYVTDSPTTGTAQLKIYDNYATCTDPSGGALPVLDLTILGLPATISPGSLTPFYFDINMTAFEFCMQADGDGEYDDGFSDRFGFTLEMSTQAGSMIGPIVGARPGAFAPTADGTVFQNPGAGSGSGLGTVDQWYDVDPVNGNNCYDWGGYDAVDNDPAFGSFWFVLESDLNVSCVSCADDIDDVFEPNDSCGTAAPVASNSLYTNLLVKQRAVDSDFYRVTIPPNGILRADALFSNAEIDIDMRLFNDDCTTQFDISQSISDNELIEYFNCGDTPIDVVLEIYGWDSLSNADCGTYALLLNNNMACAADDMLEDNDTCLESVPISEGTSLNLSVSLCDPDYYRIFLDPGETLDVTAAFNAASVDIDVELFELGPDCDVSPLDSSAGVTGTENVFLVNTTGTTRVYVVKVFVYDGFGTPATEQCGGYTLEFVRNDGSAVGSNFCFAETNTSGNGAHIFGTGSDEVANNDFVLNCIFLPTNQFGFFFNSTDAFFVANPAGSDGNICISGLNIGRFDGDVKFSGPSGFVFLNVDLMNFPQPSGLVAVMPGQSFNFQYWTRDISSGGSNFSDALGVNFQ